MRRAGRYLLLAVSLLFVAGGVGMVATGAEGGWPTLLFFGFCAAVFVGQLWPGLLRREGVEAEELLERFPGPVDCAMDIRRMLLLALGAAVFGGVVVRMLLHERVSGPFAWILWGCAGLICLSVPVLVWLAATGGRLRLTGEGFELRHGWTRRFTPWEATSEFEVASIAPSGSPLVVYDDAGASGRLAKANAGITGRNSGLPDSFGWPHEDLAAFLNAWRGRALFRR